MKKALLYVWLLGILPLVNAADAGIQNDRTFKFWVSFTDKKGSPYTVLRPWDFLSERSLARRTRAGSVQVNYDDLPVNATYVSKLRQEGVVVKLTSRWLNGAMAVTHDSTLAAQIAKLSFVKEVQLIGTFFKKRGAAEWDPDITSQSATSSPEQLRIAVRNTLKPEEANDGYGMGWKQISQLNGQYLHRKGFRGKGVMIAILDAGFYRANLMEAFDSLFQQGRILGTADFVEVGSEVYNDDDHGTAVLSCLAANAPGIMVGTAPDASYFLLRTEDANTETLAEEFQWLCGAEFADSAGVDLISSSLGYTEFDDKRMSHTYSDLNGRTTVITRAANMAWERGMIVVNSAGNEGDEPWKHIGAPADAEGVIAVAAVDEYGDIAEFSSMGPTADSRVKPDLSALGKRAVILNSNGYFIRSNGTSYSAPILAGAIACLLQAGVSFSPAQIREAVTLSANGYLDPDFQKGYGIPDLKMALDILENGGKKAGTEVPFHNWPANDTAYGKLELRTWYQPSEKYTYTLFNDRNKVMISGELTQTHSVIYAISLVMPREGVYSIVVNDGEHSWRCEFYYFPAKKP